jgi:hypothetical protein
MPCPNDVECQYPLAYCCILNRCSSAFLSSMPLVGALYQISEDTLYSFIGQQRTPQALWSAPQQIEQTLCYFMPALTCIRPSDGSPFIDFLDVYHPGCMILVQRTKIELLVCFKRLCAVP